MGARLPMETTGHLLLKAQAFSHPGPSSLSMSSLPASCLQCLCKAFTLGVTVTQEAEVKAPLTRDAHCLHSTVPLQGPDTTRSGGSDCVCLQGRMLHSSWDARFTQGSHKLFVKYGREADTDARESSQSAGTSCTSKGLAGTLGARGRTW